MISVFSNSLGNEELAVVQKVFNSRWLGKGKECDGFEEEFGKHLGVKNVLLFNCCTSAIYVGLRALGLDKGDEVIIPSINFVATASAVVDMGATPVFADVDRHSLNILPEEIDRLKTPKTRAVFLLHYGGHPCKMDDIYAACGKTIYILEDSANSVMSSYKGVMCGTLGDLGFYSFDAMKILSMGDGGGLYVKDEKMLEKARIMRYFGFSPDAIAGYQAMLNNKKTRWWEFELDTTSGRFISNDILASIGRIQLKKLPQFIARRKQIWETYQKEFVSVSVIKRPPEPIEGAKSSYYLYWIQIPNRDKLASYLIENDVYCTFRYYPLHLVKYYKANYHLENAESVNETTLNLPIHQNLSDNEVQKIIELVKKFYRDAKFCVSTVLLPRTCGL